MKINNAFNTFLFGILAILLTGCLPAQKTTQCGADEAYNATHRTCVPVQGSASSTNVYIKSKLPSNSYATNISGSTVNHSIVVNDVYNYGYDVKWFLHYSYGAVSTSSQVASDTLVYTFNPGFLYGAGNYILEAAIYNEDTGANIDSVSWTITVGGTTTPTLSNPIPGTSSISYASNITSANFSFTMNNPDGLSGNYYWLLNGSPSVSGAFSPSTTGFSQTVNPQSLGVGIHTLELKLTSSLSSSDVYDSYVWIINVVNPDLPLLVGANPEFTYTVIAVDGLSYDNEGYLYDHDGDGNISTPLEDLKNKYQTSATPGLCVTVDNWDKNGDGTADIYLKFEINDAQVGPLVSLTANTYCVTDDLTAQVLVNSELGVSKNIEVSTYSSSTNALLEQRSWALNVIPKNSAPIIRISPNTDSFGCDTSSEILYTGCTMAQSVDNDLNNSYADANDQDNTVKIAIDVLQDYETDYINDSSTYGEDENAVYFQVRKSGDAGYQDLAGSSDYSRADCSVASGTSKATITDTPPTGVITTYFCSLSMDAFSSGGPVAPGNYEIKAYITDAGSEWGGFARDSNSVEWQISVNEFQSAPVIQPQGAIASNQSYITTTTDGSGCTADTGSLLDSVTGTSEGQYIVVNTVVRDLERDNLSISVRMQNRVSGGTSSISALTSVTRTDDAEYHTIQTCFQVPEWTNNGPDAVSTVHVTVSDIPDGAGLGLTDSEVFQLLVSDNNPPPVFADNSDVDLSGNYVYAGFPFNITAPAYSDASIANDGNIVTWQWQVCVGDSTNAAECLPSGGANWVNIPNANSDAQSAADLVWTPNPDIAASSNVNLRLCLGDNGYNNPADCSSATSSKAWINLTANPAGTMLSNNVDLDENVAASWYDGSGAQYVAYVVADGAASKIHVVKMLLDANGNWSADHEITFPVDETEATAIADDLSMTGVANQAVLISYRAFVGSFPLPRVRRIDISNGTLSWARYGLYDDAETATTGDRDMVVGLSDNSDSSQLTNTSYTYGTGKLTLNFSASPGSGEFISFNLASGSTVTLTHGTDWCATPCADGDATAASLAAAITANPTLSKELSVTHSPPSSTLVINGPSRYDYVDADSELAMAMGDITVDPISSVWRVPFADGAASSKIAILGTNQTASTPINGAIESTSVLSTTKTAITELRSAHNSAGNMVIAAKANANVHTYLVDNTPAVLSSVENAFDLSTAGLSDINNIAMGLDQEDNVYVAGVGETTLGATYLSAAVFNAAVTQVSTKPMFTGSMNELTGEGIENVAIAANNLVASDGTAVIAASTSSTHATIPGQLHFARITQNLTDFTQAIAFTDYQIADYATSPKVNTKDMLTGSTLWMTPMSDVTIGSADEAASANTQSGVFLTFFEDDGSSNPELKNGFYNVSPESIQTNDTATSGSYPAFISN